MELSFGKTRNDGFVTTKGTISVNSDGELVYLHCYAFMVSGTYSLYVSDGFRSGIQDRFTRGFNNRKIMIVIYLLKQHMKSYIKKAEKTIHLRVCKNQNH